MASNNPKKRGSSSTAPNNLANKRPRPNLATNLAARSPPGMEPMWLYNGYERRTILDEISARKQAEWLARSSTWQQLPAGYVGEKILGAGGYGLCGLWRYEGNVPNYPKHTVVKQTGYMIYANAADRQYKGYILRQEAKLLDLCMRTGTDHVVKMFKQFHEEMGTGTHRDYDPEMMVARMYLEYCDGGDMQVFIRKMVRNEQDRRVPAISEEAIWRIWDCLAKAQLVLDHGTENREDPPWTERPIAHFDIKPNNIFIKSVDPSDEEEQVTTEDSTPASDPKRSNASSKAEEKDSDTLGKLVEIMEKNKGNLDKILAEMTEVTESAKTQSSKEDATKTDQSEQNDHIPNEGIKTKNSNHQNHKKLQMIFKLADFGLALQVPKTQTEAWYRVTFNRSTPGWVPPEQQPPYDIRKIIDQRSNIFAIANCIWVLLMRGRQFGDDAIAVQGADPQIKERIFYLYGYELAIKPPAEYSETLKLLLWRCLAKNPDDRPSTREIANTIELALREYDIRDPIGDGPFSHEKPIEKEGRPKYRHRMLDDEPDLPPRPNTSVIDYIFPIMQVAPSTQNRQQQQFTSQAPNAFRPAVSTRLPFLASIQPVTPLQFQSPTKPQQLQPQPPNRNKNPQLQSLAQGRAAQPLRQGRPGPPPRAPLPPRPPQRPGPLPPRPIPQRPGLQPQPPNQGPLPPRPIPYRPGLLHPGAPFIPAPQIPAPIPAQTAPQNAPQYPQPQIPGVLRQIQLDVPPPPQSHPQPQNTQNTQNQQRQQPSRYAALRLPRFLRGLPPGIPPP